MADNIQIISYLNLLELPTNKPITEEDVQSSYRKLSKIYHPDVANDRYKDGKKFIQLQEAREYLISNISEVNSLIRNGFSSSSSTSYSTSNEAYERWKQEQEFQRRQKAEEEARRKAEEAERKRKEEEKRKQEELRRQKEAEEKRRREEQELRKRIDETKTQKIIEAKKLLDELNKDDYYEEDYNKICAATMSFVDYINGIITKADSNIINTINNKFQSLVKYIGSVKTIQQIKTRKKIRIGSLVTLSSIALISLFLILLINVIIPAGKYSNANKLLAEGKFGEAYEIYNELGDYKNSTNLSSISVYLSIIEDDSSEYLEYNRIASGCDKYGINFTINYDTKGGLLTSDDSQTAKSSQKAGYSFQTWKIVRKTYDAETNTLIFDVSAIYEIITYTINYNLDGGVVNNPSSYDVESIININNPTRIGYTFIGWKDDNTGDIVDSLIINKGNYGDKSYTALYEKNPYSILFDSNGGNDIEPIEVRFGDNVDLPTPINDGYNFDGWYHDNGRIYKIVGYKYPYNYTLVAKWTPIIYSITCVYDNGQNDSIIRYDIKSNNIELEHPSREGYDFAGWSTERGGQISKDVIIEHGSIGDKKYYANWTPKKYIINYNLNEGTNNINNPSYFYADELISILGPIREGYSFLGWSQDDSIDISDNPEIGKGTYRDIVFTAHWEPITYAISYELLGGTNNDNNPKTYTHDANDILLYDPYKEGYSFDYWLMGESQLLNNTIKAEIIGDVTVIAKWTPKEFSILLDVNTGSPLNDDETIVVFDEIPSLPTPNKVGYDFIGWYFNDKKIENDVWKIADNVTLTAKWTPRDDILYRINYYLQNIEDDNYYFSNYENRYDIADSLIDVIPLDVEGFITPAGKSVQIFADGSQTVDFYFDRNYYDINFITNGGTAIAQKHLKYDSTFTCDETIREGYTFAGWFTDINLTNENTCYNVPNNNVNLYAWWEEESKPYNFTYKLVENHYELTGYTEQVESQIIIPMYINGILVSKLTDNVFDNAEKVEILTIQNNIEEIGENTLRGYTIIKKAYLPSSLNRLYLNMFGENNSLEEIVLPYAGISLEEPYLVKFLLQYCNNIKKITIIDGELSQQAFDSISSVEEIVLPQNLQNLPWRAFYSCENLRKIELPDGITVIPEEAFYNCKKLENIDLNNVTSIEKNAFANCESIKKIESINLVSVKSNAFASCHSLEIFNCPHVYIDEIGVFYDCSKMEYINISSMDFYGDYWGDGIRIYQYYNKVEGNYLNQEKSFMFLFGWNSTTPEEDWKTHLVEADEYGQFYFRGLTPKSLIAVEFSSIPNGSTGVFGATSQYANYEGAYLVCNRKDASINSRTYIETLLYKGTQTDYERYFTNNGHIGAVYFYSKEVPTEEGNYWHYNSEGIPEIY